MTDNRNDEFDFREVTDDEKVDIVDSVNERSSSENGKETSKESTKETEKSSDKKDN